MSVALVSLLPTFVLIVMGWLAKRLRLVADAFWEPAEKLTYFLFFPALLLESTATASLGSLPLLSMAAALIGSIVLTGLLVLLLKPALGLDGPAFTSVFQGAIRPNTYVAAAVILPLFGPPGVAVLSVALALLIPTVNVMSVLALVRYVAATASWRLAILQILRNPLILSIAAGALLNLSGIGLPKLAAPLVHVLGQVALPIGLLAVGAGLDLAATRAKSHAVWSATAVKLLAVPALTALACRLAAIDGLTFQVCVLYGAIPCSASSYILARQMGGDARLMAGIITATTLAAMAAVPAVLLLLA
jgi:malonate transporter